MSIVKLERDYALSVANWLSEMGVPLVLAHISRGNAFSLEPNWPKTPVGPYTLNRWLNGQGDLIAAITGHIFDVFDFDPQNGGDLAEFLEYAGSTGRKSLKVQAICATPSGGYHLWVRTLGLKKRPIATGVDYQGLNGIAFIPPSLKASKRNGLRRPYRWTDFSPGATDSGKAIYELLAEWAGHSPRTIASSQSEHVNGGLTRRQVRSYIEDGIPPDQNHDDTLKDIVWHLCLWRIDPATAFTLWQRTIDNTPDIGRHGKRAYEEKDFERQWSGAERKLGSNRSRSFAGVQRVRAGSPSETRTGPD